MTIYKDDAQRWDTLMKRVQHHAEGKQDATITTSRMRYVDDNVLMLPSKLNAGYKAVHMTSHARQQLFNALQLPDGYVTTLESRNKRLANELINDALQTANTPLYWRFSEDRLRGVLTNKTPAFDNLAVVEAIDSVLSIGKTDAVIRSMALDDERFYLKMLFDSEYRDQTGIVKGNYLKVGFLTRTSEIHRGSFEVKPFVYRWSCTNDAVVSGYQYASSSYRLTSSEIKEIVTSVVSRARLEASSIVENMLDSQSIRVHKPQRALQDIGSALSMNKKEQKSLILAYREEPMPTQYGVAQAFTRYAQSLALDKRDRFETVGGLLVQPTMFDYDTQTFDVSAL